MEEELFMPEESPIITEGFFEASAREVAINLLGRTIVRTLPNSLEQRAVIREVSAWQGEEESSAETIRYEPGTLGVSRKMGQYLVDIGTGVSTRPSCITLVGLYTSQGEVIQGPGNVSKYLRIDDTFDLMPIHSDHLRIESAQIAHSGVLQRSKRAPDNCKGYFYINTA